jgi:hypothetical protein
LLWRGTGSSNPLPSSGESANFRFLQPVALAEAVSFVDLNRLRIVRPPL